MDNSTQGTTDYKIATLVLYATIPPIPWNTSDYVNDYAAPMPPQDPISSQFVKVLRGIFLVLCLIENSLALYILCKNVRIGRNKTFFLYMLISIACADILKAAFIYLMTYAAFSPQAEDVWSFGNALCKMYLTFSEIASRVISLILVALAWDATRNSSSTGRKEHTKKFSAIMMFFLWVMATSFSSIYFVFSGVFHNACGVSPEGIIIMTIQLDFAFDVTVDLILTILCVVVFFRVRRRKKEMNAQARSTKFAYKSNKKSQRRDDDGIELDHSGEWCDEKPDEGEVTLICEGQKQSSSEHPPETGRIVDVGDGQSNTSQSTWEQEFKETRTEAKIVVAVSLPLIALSLLSLLLLPYLMNYLSYSQNVYISFCAQMADAMYGIIKPAIYACIDREFRKRYTQLSPLACCCLRKICRGSSQQGVAAEKSRATQEGSV